jgi:hypothetical protein
MPGRAAHGDRTALAEVATVGVIMPFRPARIIQRKNNDPHRR